MSIHPAMRATSMIVAVLLTFFVPIAGMALAVVLTIVNWKASAPWRVAYIVLAVLILFFTYATPG